MPPTAIDEYIAGFPPEIRAILRKIRATVRKAAPEAVERITYRMPNFALNESQTAVSALRSGPKRIADKLFFTRGRIREE